MPKLRGRPLAIWGKDWALSRANKYLRPHPGANTCRHGDLVEDESA